MTRLRAELFIKPQVSVKQDSRLTVQCPSVLFFLASPASALPNFPLHSGDVSVCVSLRGLSLQMVTQHL